MYQFTHLYPQLTFTPSWGKRSSNPLSMNMPGSFGVQDSCKTPVDSLMVIYRMIQVKTLHCALSFNQTKLLRSYHSFFLHRPKRRRYWSAIKSKNHRRDGLLSSNGASVSTKTENAALRAEAIVFIFTPFIKFKICRYVEYHICFVPPVGCPSEALATTKRSNIDHIANGISESRPVINFCPKIASHPG